LKKAIESVFFQTYPSIELIIGDDGSQVPIESYVYQLVSDLSNPQSIEIRVVRNHHRGISSARNNAIAYSYGKWLVWLDSDDTLQRDCIMNLMKESDFYSLVIGECDVYENDTVTRRKPKPYFEKVKALLGTENDPFLLNIISIQPQLILKSDLIEIGAFNEDFHYAELTELFLRYISIKGIEKVIFIENAVYNYNRNRESAHTTNRNELFKYRLMALTNYKNYCNISSAELEYVGRDTQTGFQRYKLINYGKKSTIQQL
jgi:glycosyltransferase involved in cell wall biosynthesis